MTGSPACSTLGIAGRGIGNADGRTIAIRLGLAHRRPCGEKPRFILVHLHQSEKSGLRCLALILSGHGGTGDIPRARYFACLRVRDWWDRSPGPFLHELESKSQMPIEKSAGIGYQPVEENDF